MRAFGMPAKQRESHTMARLREMLTVRQFSGETVMALVIGIAALGLLMTALMVAELRQPVRTNAIRLHDLRVGDRVLAVFALVMFTVTFVNVLIVLGTH